MDSKTAWKKFNDIFRPSPVPSNEMYHAFLKATEQYSPIALADAYQHTIEHETRFPPIALFKDYCDVMQQRIADERHEKQKLAEKIAVQHGQVFGKDPKAKRVLKIVRDLMAGNITRRGYLDALATMGIDTVLDDWYKQMGYEIDEQCRMATMRRKI